MKHRRHSVFGPRRRDTNVFMCICSHHSMEHVRKSGKCEVENCDCTKASSTNTDYLIERQNLIGELGFGNHINETATCMWCCEDVQLGRWYDPHLLNRALFHTRQMCKSKPAKPTAAQQVSQELRIMKMKIK